MKAEAALPQRHAWLSWTPSPSSSLTSRYKRPCQNKIQICPWVVAFQFFQAFRQAYMSEHGGEIYWQCRDCSLRHDWRTRRKLQTTVSIRKMDVGSVALYPGWVFRPALVPAEFGRCRVLETPLSLVFLHAHAPSAGRVDSRQCRRRRSSCTSRRRTVFVDHGSNARSITGP